MLTKFQRFLTTYLSLIDISEEVPFPVEGQIILKGLFGILEFSQKTKEQIRCSSKNEFTHLFFGEI